MAAHTAATAPKTTMRQLMKRPRRPHQFQLQRAYRGRPADGSSWSIFSALLASAATARQSTLQKRIAGPLCSSIRRVNFRHSAALRGRAMPKMTATAAAVRVLECEGITVAFRGSGNRDQSTLCRRAVAELNSTLSGPPR